MAVILVPPSGAGGGGGGGGEVDISPDSIDDLSDAFASKIAGEALTVNATISSEVEVKNDTGTPVPVVGTVTIGTSVTPGTAAANLGKAEDSVAASGDVGVAVWGVQQAIPQLPNALGDYSGFPLSQKNGLFVAPMPIQNTLVVTPTITAGAYVAGDQIGALMDFTTGGFSGRGGQVVGARLLDKGMQKANVHLDLYEGAPTLVNADNGVYDITDAQMVLGIYIGTIDFVTDNYRDTASNSRCVGSVNGGAPILPYGATAGNIPLTGVLYTSGTPTYVSTSDLVVYLTIVQF